MSRGPGGDGNKIEHDARVSDRFPHNGGCPACRYENRCNYCGEKLKHHCTNGRCGSCHVSVCTSAVGLRGHGFGKREVTRCVECGRKLGEGDGVTMHLKCITRLVSINEDVEPGDAVTQDMIDDSRPSSCGFPITDCVFGGAHGGGKMHMTEQQHKALHAKDPDYVAKLMTPANHSAKTSKEMQGLTFVGFDYERHELRTLAHMLAQPHGLARVKVQTGDEVKGFASPSHSSTCRVLVINGVGITWYEPGSSIDKALEKALKTEPSD